LAGATRNGESIAQAKALVLRYAGGPEGAERAPEPGFKRSGERSSPLNRGRVCHNDISDIWQTP
jgi:hypothetical protein